ncbi:MAG: flagellar basal-body rod protein FlgF [Rhodospirillaceae bacterium]|nr:flagellar basal-body rod protein FlgF [Rhodospirillaceae bacterium]
MENTSIIAASKQAAIRRNMDVIANNIANMNTTGFKGGKMMFTEHLERSRGGYRIGGDKNSYVRDIATARDITEGPMISTGNKLDLAVSGDGYFVVNTATGNNYTRNGNFQLDNAGQLVTRNGDPLLSDQDEPFFFSPEDTQITIARDGSVSTENGVIGKLNLVTFQNLQDMKPVAGGLHTTKQQPQPVTNPLILQGMLEGSNVNPIIEMTRMIEAHRSYGSVKDMIQKEDERVKKMIEEFARVA